MGTAMTGFLEGFLKTHLALQQRDEESARHAQDLELKKQDLDLRRKILQGQEASRQLQDQTHQLTIQKMLVEHGRQLGAANLLTQAEAPPAPGGAGGGMDMPVIPNVDPAQPALTSPPPQAPVPLAPAASKAIFDKIADHVGQNNGITPEVIQLYKTSVMPQETRNYDNTAVSPKGAVGVSQLMPVTQREMGVTDPRNPVENIRGGLGYLQKLYDKHGGDPAKTLAEYNAGPVAMQKYGGVPPFPETQRYVQNGMAAYEATPPSLVRQPSTAPVSPEMGRMNADLGALQAKEQRIQALLAKSPGLRADPAIQKTLKDLRENRTELEKQRLELTKEERPKFTPEFTDYVIGEAQQRPEVLFTTPEGKQQLTTLRQQYRTEKLDERIRVSAAQGREGLERELDKPISREDAADMGLPYGLTKREVAALNIVPLTTDLQKQVFTAEGTSLLLDRLEERTTRLFKGVTPESRLGDTGKKLVERFAQTNPDVAVYMAQKKAFLASFARAAGEVGTLNEGDVGRADSMFPALFPPDTEAVATQKLKELRLFLDDKLRRGRQGAPKGGTGAPAAPAGPASAAPPETSDLEEKLKKRYGIK